ncbi:uncharacterized protein B0H64DRAFT_389184 [Chaetomium fimeti]|uniref:SMP-30/Gluconolactonase/LRE-like region domain-containing protein n=1 Tax=Chaetomium fimeti TaxID=1854472 RepID=A0AAE0HN57_9PEZI|nr:hypothetical protein B0H64DRAFT_389184 [Chaetomium fimeti]
MRVFSTIGLLPMSLVLLLGSSTPVQANKTCGPSVPLPMRLVHQFSKPTYLQCLHIRANGDMLLGTVFPNASIYYLTGASTDNPTVSTIHTFAGIPSTDVINGVTGIVETEPDVFAFTGGIQQSLGLQRNGTWGVWQLDLRPTRNNNNNTNNNTSAPIIQELVHIPDSGLLSAVVALPKTPTVVLVADTSLGQVLRVDTVTRRWEVAVRDWASMHYPPWASLQFGVNGLALRGGYLYWTNSFVAALYRIRMTDDGYPAPGAVVEDVATVRSLFVDGLVFGPGERDTLWAATNADNRVLAIGEDGEYTTVAGAPDEMTMAGAVAPRFGTLPGDEHTLYVSTSGGVVLPVNGTEFEGGKVVAVDTRPFFHPNNECGGL